MSFATSLCQRLVCGRRALMISCVGLCLMLGTVSPTFGASAASSAKRPSTSKPSNILFIIMDDVGIDQLTAFNPGTTHPVSTPNIDTLVQGGVRFVNCWMMPECSPSRSCFFTGRWPLRTGVNAAILTYDLPSAQVSPYEITTPKVLAKAGYTSA